MAQLSKISRNNTTTEKDTSGRIVGVTLHYTKIFSRAFNADDSQVVTLNTGGRLTVTTCTRLNQTFRQLDLPLSCGRAGGVFGVRARGGQDWKLPEGKGVFVVHADGSVTRES